MIRTSHAASDSPTLPRSEAPPRRRARTVLATAVIAAAGLTGIIGPGTPAAATGPAASRQSAATGQAAGPRPVPDPPAEQAQIGTLTGSAHDTNPPAAPALRAGTGLHVGRPAVVAVAVATVWTSPSSPRAVDRPALGNPVKLDDWNAALKSTETRRALTGKTQTQALYGEEVRVLELKQGWARVAVRSQANPGDRHGYEGWMPSAQLIGNPGFARAAGAPGQAAARAVVTAEKATVSDAPGGRAVAEVSMNTVLPVLTSDADAVRVRLPNGTTGWLAAGDARVQATGASAPAATAADVVATAKRFEGVRYLWGGVSAYGFDCSGLTYAAYRAHGIELPRDSGPQFRAGTAVSPQALKPGDLLFFAGRGGKGTIHHVGMYIGDGRMIHAPNAAKNVHIVDWKSWDAGREFAGARRYL